jgi:septum site-determining protein MinC
MRSLRGENGNRIKPGVIIKGIRGRLVLVVDDSSPFDQIMEEMRSRLTELQRHIQGDSALRVSLQTGNRQWTDEEKREIRLLLASQKHLVLDRAEGDGPDWLLEDMGHFGSAAASGSMADGVTEGAHPPRIHKATVRSGQRIEHAGDLVIIGDVNPGGEVIAGGDVYVMGCLRGTAHAGATGDTGAIIAAVRLEPTQLRICHCIARSPETEDRRQPDGEMEFAYINGGKIVIDKLAYLHHVRFRWREGY